MPEPELTVAILTFRRPSQLSANLDAVAARVQDAAGMARGSILVVDNDPERSAEAVVTGSRSVPIRYVCEPTPGIPAARNRALDEAAESRLLAFIDDDEIPEDGWLVHLLDTWRTTGADAVMGRVISQLPDEVDPWVVAGGFFSRPSRPTGTRLEAAATGNLLLDLDTVRRLGLRFDESLGLAGGEDSVFTTQLTRGGGVIVWCQESVTLDPVTPERATRAWARHRAFSHGNVLERTRLRLAGSRRRRLFERTSGVAGGAARIVVGALRVVWGTIARDLRHRVRGERGILRGAGVLSGALGYHHSEYRRPRTTGPR